MSSGIYKIVNVANGKFYVGSSKNIERRWKVHKTQLNNNNHHNDYLQKSWNKYGKTNFSFEIIVLVAEESLFEEEQLWIDKLKPEYNIGSVGGGDCISKHQKNKEFRELQRKISINKYINMSDEEKAKLSRFGPDNPNWRGGTSKKYCGCGKQMVLTANQCSECFDKSGANNPFYGKHHSIETKAKLSKQRIGKPNIKCSHKVSINGVVYESKHAAAKALKISDGLITYRFKKKYQGYILLS